MPSHRLPLAVDKLADRAAHLGIQAEAALVGPDSDEADRLETLAAEARNVLRRAVAEDLGEDTHSRAVSDMTGNAMRNAYARERAGGAR